MYVCAAHDTHHDRIDWGCNQVCIKSNHDMNSIYLFTVLNYHVVVMNKMKHTNREKIKICRATVLMGKNENLKVMVVSLYRPLSAFCRNE